MSIQAPYDVLMQKVKELELLNSSLLIDLQKKDTVLLNKENILLEMESIIFEKESIIFEKDSILLEKESIILEKDSILLEKDSIILEKQRLIEKFQRMLFGQKRERFENISPIQLGLEFGELFTLEEIAQIEDRINQKKEQLKEKEAIVKPIVIRPGRKPLPKHLDVKEITISPDEDLTNMILVGEEISESLGFTPSSFHIQRIVRLKYAPKGKEGSFLIAPLPDSIFPKCMASPSLIAQICVDKFVDHLPLYRQLQRFKRIDIDINASTIDNWVKLGIGRLEILYDFCLEQIKKEKYIQADETTIKVLDKDKKGSTHLGYYWAYNAPLSDLMVFKYEKGRGGEFPASVLKDFKGHLQADAYSGYNAIASKEDIIRLGCWAHVRRKFDEALGNNKNKAEIALHFIQELYDVERKAKNENMSPENRKILRLDKALPVYNDIGKWICSEISKTLPKSAIGKAIRYTFNLWDELGVYLSDGNLEIDNNFIENAIRPIALGRKNYLFAGSHDAAQRAAIIYSFMYQCKKNNVNPYKWLLFVFENIMETSILKFENLLPANIKNNPKF